MDSSLIVSSSHDYTVKIWDAYTGECVKTLTDYKGFNTGGASFNHSRKYFLATAGVLEKTETGMALCEVGAP